VRKFFVAAIAAALAIASFSVVAIAGKGEPGTSLNLTMKPNKVDRPASLDIVFEPTKVDDQGTSDTSDDVFTPTEDNTIRLPKKSSVDTRAAPRCKKTPTEVGQGENCPNKTKIGVGETVSFVGGQPIEGGDKRVGGNRLTGTIEIFNTKTDLILVVTTCAPGSGPGTANDCVPAGQPVVLTGEWSNVAKRPKLFVETPPALHQSGVVIVRLETNLDKATKTVKQDGKEVLRSLFLTPETCGGNWASDVHTNYTDGSEQTINDKQKCKKPAS
jgi:hypothetical protein